MPTAANTVPETPLLPHVRPRFQLQTRLTANEIVERFRTQLSRPDCPVVGKAHRVYISLMLPEEEQHYWSPRLTITLEDLEDENARLLRGVYGPRPAVWTMFVFFYFVIGILVVFISIIGSSNLALGNSGAILWWVPVLLTVLASLYLVSRFGERLGREHMVILHRFVEETLEVRFADTHK